MNKQKRKLVNIRMYADVWYQAKIEAAKQRMTLQDFVETAIKEKIARLQKEG